MLRVVLDTNLLVSYFLTQGTTLSGLIDGWEQGLFVYLVSPAILDELQEVVKRPRLRRLMRQNPQPLLDVIYQDSEMTAGALVLTGVCRDPKDDKFLACAIEGEADYLVSGDQDLLAIGSYQGIQIVKPAQFLNILQVAAGGIVDE